MTPHLGTGEVWSDWLLTVLLAVAAVVQLAVLKDRTIKETALADALRWLMMSSLAAQALVDALVLTFDVIVPGLFVINLCALAFCLAGHGMLQICDRRKMRLLERLERRRRPKDRRTMWRSSPERRRPQ